MIREKAKDLLTKLKQGFGSATLFGSSYYDEETLQIIEIIARNDTFPVRILAFPKVFVFFRKTNAIFLLFFQRKRFTFEDLSDKILLVY